MNRWKAATAVAIPVLGAIITAALHRGPDNPHLPEADYSYWTDPETYATSSTVGTRTEDIDWLLNDPYGLRYGLRDSAAAAGATVQDYLRAPDVRQDTVRTRSTKTHQDQTNSRSER
jgi:hypothetical protein